MSGSSVYVDDQPFDDRLISIGKAVQDEAKRHIEQLAGVVRSIGEASGRETDPNQIAELGRLLRRAKDALKDSGVERNLVTLTDRQLEAVGAWESREFKIIGCCGTNRSGKSFVGGTAYAKYLRDDAPEGSEHLCCTVDQRLSSRNQQKIIWDNIPHELFDSKWAGPKNGFGSRAPVSILDKGGRNIVIHWMSESEFMNNMSSFEALTIETAWVDEAICLELFSAIKTRLTLSDDGRLLVSAIPLSEFFWEVIYNAKPGDGVWYKLFTPQTNPLMTPQKWAELCKSVPPHERDVRLKGVPAMAGSIVYVEFNDADHVIAPKDIPDELSYYGGLDVGMDHPTVFLLYGVSADGKHYVVDEYVSRNQTPEQDVPHIKAIIGNRTLTTGYVYVDPAAFQVTKANNVSVGQQYTKAGLPVLPSRRTSDVGEMNQVYQIKEMLRCDELFVSENCPQLIKEMHVWKFRRDRQNKPLTKDSFEDRNNDALDALRYVTTMHPTYQKNAQKAKIAYF